MKHEPPSRCRLLLDAGNTAVKWAVWAGDPDVAQDAEDHRNSQLDPIARDAAAQRLATGATPFVLSGRLFNDDPDLHAQLADVLKQAAGACAPVVGAWACAVASETVRTTLAAALASASVALRWLPASSCWRLGPWRLQSDYRAGQLGADRWHALIAAYAQSPGQRQVVVNAGTATTVDVIGSTGHFSGGVIAPGVDLMLKSLAQGTARLPQLHLSAMQVTAGAGVQRAEPASHGSIAATLNFPAHTEAAIAQGVIRAQRALVRDVMAQAFMPSRVGDRVVFTGGHGAALADWVKAPGLPATSHEADCTTPAVHVVDDHLVLRGVALHGLSVHVPNFAPTLAPTLAPAIEPAIEPAIAPQRRPAWP